MSAKCIVCKKAFVSAPGQMCITCRLRSNSTNSYVMPAADSPVRQQMNVDSALQTMESQKQKTNHGINAGSSAKNCFTGIIRNAHKEQKKKGLHVKWWNSVRYGTPFPLTDTQYEFTLYSQGNYTANRADGYGVVFYGETNYSFLSDNSQVRVIGQIDRNGVIQAKEIIGSHTNFRMRANSAISGNAVRVLSLLILVLILSGVMVICNLGTQVQYESAGAASMPDAESLLFTVIMLAAAYFVAKRKRMRRKYLICIILVGIAMLPISFMLSALCFAAALLMALIRRFL